MSIISFFHNTSSVLPVSTDTLFFYFDRTHIGLRGYRLIMLLLLVRSFIVFRTTRAAMLLFFCCSLYLSYILSMMCLLLGLLLVLVYLGALMVLFAFI